MEQDAIHRSTYSAIPSPCPSPQESHRGHERGRTLRILGALALASAAGAAVWRGGASRSRQRASLRSPLGLQEHQDCKGYEVHVDFRNVAELRTLEGVHDSKACGDHCAAEPSCTVWSWGKLRNIDGLTDMCWLKAARAGEKVQKYSRYGVVAGVRTGTTCFADLEEGSSLLQGHMKVRDGLCLQANGALVAMATCAEGNVNQEWTYTEKTGQIKSANGFCLDAVHRYKPLADLQMYPCNPGNWSQQWMFDNDTGIIKIWRGVCLEAAEQFIDGGLVYTNPCDANSVNQQWAVGVPGRQPPQRHYPTGTLYCFALMVPDTYEQDLLAMQHRKRVSLFACDESAVYSNRVIEVDDGLVTLVVDSDLKCGKGGEFGTALNLDIFIAVWTKVVSEARFELHDWTVKVDPDCVFFPDKLRPLLRIHPESKLGVFLNNCKFGMHGPLEIFSRHAVSTWAAGSPRCVEHFQKRCGGDCFWGEDLFIDQCLWKVLGVRRDNDFRLLLEDHCEPPSDWDSCTDRTRPAFHPFKTMDGYTNCLENASKMGDLAPALTTYPPVQTTVEAPAAPQPTQPPQQPPHPPPLSATSAEGGCHTANQEEERCYIAVKWAMEKGIRLHPEWYPTLLPGASWYDFQAVLHLTPQMGCPMPCKSEDK